MLHVITPLRSLYAYINKKCLKKCAPKYKENIQRVSDKDRTKEGGGGKGEGGRGRKKTIKHSLLYLAPNQSTIHF